MGLSSRSQNHPQIQSLIIKWTILKTQKNYFLLFVTTNTKRSLRAGGGPPKKIKFPPIMGHFSMACSPTPHHFL